MHDGALAAWIRVTDRAFVAVNDEGRICLWNDGAKSIFGYASEDLLNQPISAVFPARYGSERQREIWQRLLEAGKKKSPPIELVLVHQDGRERSVEVAVSYWRHDAEGFVGLALTDLGPILDLQDELMRLASFPEFNPAPIVEVDLSSGEVSYVNEAWFSLSAQAQEAVIEELLRPSEDEHRVTSCFVEEQRFELRIHRIAAWECVRGYVRNVTQRYRAEQALRESYETLECRVEERTAELARANERMRHEVMERKKAEQAAREASAAKSAFLANVSHELRTPLNAIIGYSELVEDSVDDAQGLEDLSRVSRSAWALLNMINSILDLSKVEAGKMEAHLRGFGLEALLEDLAVATEPLVHRNANRLIITRESGFNLIYSDEQKIRQVLINLVSNASKFTSNGKIEVCARRLLVKSVIWAEFTVRDTGIGLPPEKLAKIFEPFSQADSHIRSTYGGTGLGLAICQQFCDLLQGNISASSELGVGTTFTVRIPSAFPPG